ncbi:hypothetical protein [Cetobacterium sp. ZWU0022]|uniref:hypothetical protein n=1 Tax=Cetobacterium sp. ZWU0022 TaxID=1340502 RepID=UPI0006459ECA|nr:hypothetical protein [Cetobacterium sp. ZWU0022]
MSTKVFGNVATGNHIEIRTKMSIVAKRDYQNSHKAAMSLANGDLGFKMVSSDADSDIILLRGALLSVTTNGNTVTRNNLTIQMLDDSVENTENFEDAVEFLKRENKLGPYSGLENLSKEELLRRKGNLEESIKIIDKVLEEPGN